MKHHLIRIVSAAALFLTMTVMVFAADPAIDPYGPQDLKAAYHDQELILPEDTKEGAVEETANGLMFHMNMAQYQETRMELVREFDFDGNAVGRISVDGLSEKRRKAEVQIYLDDETEPVASIALKPEQGKIGWKRQEILTADVLPANITGKHTVSIGLKVTGAEAGKKVDVLLRSIEFCESSIPVVYVNIDESEGSIDAMNGDYSHQTECYGDMTIAVPDGYQAEYSSKALKTKTYTMEYIRGRGNSTWMADKKPYKVKLERKAGLLGMGENKHWILLANRYDNSLLRNKMTYWLGAELGMPYTPKLVPVELVVNGMYYGSYDLCEQIRIDKSRVNIDDLSKTPDATDEPTITGGYLLSLGSETDEKGGHEFETSRNQHFLIEEPDFENGVNEAQFNYIKNYVQKTENAIYGKDFKDGQGTHYADYLDIEQAIDYFWVQEFSKNGDAYGSNSTYLYKPREGKLYWGPLWDFDYVAWGDLEYGYTNVDGFDTYQGTWFKQLMKDKDFEQRVEQRWPELKAKLEEITKPGGWLDQQKEQTGIAWRYDHEKWGSYSESGEYYDGEYRGEGDEETAKARDLDAEVDQLRSWIRARSEWVDANMADLHPHSCTLKLKVGKKVWKTIPKYEGDTIGSLPKPTAPSGSVFKGWYIGSQKISGEYEMDGNLTLTAKFRTVAQNTHAKKLLLPAKEVYAFLESKGMKSNQIINPIDSVEKDITWTSSDPSVASVSKSGYVTFRKAGDTVIKGTLANGVAGSYQLHIISGRSADDAPETVLNKTEITLTKGQYTKLTFDTLVIDSAESTWAVSDPDIAMINRAGLVHAKRVGTTWATIETFDKYIEVEIIVKDKPIATSSIQSLKARKGSFALKIKAGKGKVTGYQVKFSRNKKFTKETTVKNLKGKKNKSKTFTGLRRHKKYYVKVRTYYKTASGTRYSKWSKVKRVRTK